MNTESFNSHLAPPVMRVRVDHDDLGPELFDALALLDEPDPAPAAVAEARCLIRAFLERATTAGLPVIVG